MVTIQSPVSMFLPFCMTLNNCKKKKFPGCGVLKNGASQPFFFCPDRFKIAEFIKSALHRRNYKIIMMFGRFLSYY